MYNSIVIDKKNLNKKIIYLKLQLKDKNEINFLTGQFISMQVSNNDFRPYSIASRSIKKDIIELFISASHNGVGANYIRNLKINDQVKFNGPFGRFTLNQNKKNNYIFIATGAGIAPILPLMQDIFDKNKNKNVNINLLFGIRDNSEIFALDILEQLKNNFPNFNYLVCFSKKNPDTKNLNFFSGRVTKVLQNKNSQLNNFLNNNSDFYICGNPQMIFDCCNILLNKKIDNSNIHFERFTIQNKDK